MARPEDFRDDFDPPPSRSGEHPTSMGMIGFIFAVVSVALLIVVAVLWHLMNQEDQRGQNASRERWMMLWFMFLDSLSLFSALTAIVLGARGLAASNSLYRGYSLAALVLGILEIIGTMIFGCVLTCFAALAAGK